MGGSEFKLNSQLLPEGFPRHFDAHVYYGDSAFSEALELRDKAIDFFRSRPVFVGQMIPKPIGPHPLPMFELNFPKSLFPEVVIWLMHQRGGLSVLVHELTGDDLYDHTQAALWMGEKLPLRYDLFRADAPLLENASEELK